MFNLFKSEFLRYRNRALLVALVHMAIFAFLEVLAVDINTVPIFNLWLLGNMVAGAVFGIMQMNAHKRINHWIYLLQRPLAPWKIATGLAAAGGLLVLLALVLPFVLSLARRQLAEANGIELRHYLQLGLIVPALLLAYVYACFLALYTHKFKFIGLTVFMSLINNNISADVYLVLFWLGIVAVVCFFLWFKPDLGKGATRPVFIVLSELPLHCGLFWVVINLHGMLLAASWGLFQAGPLAPVPGSVAELQFKQPRDIMLAALEGATLANAGFYRQQIDLGEIVLAPGPHPLSFPARQQRPSLDNKLLLTDPETNTTWRFSHTEMLFKGVDPRSDVVLGWLGPQGFFTELTTATERFASVPWATQNLFILDDQSLYQIDWEQSVLRKKFTLAGLDQGSGAQTPERFSDSLGIHENFVTLFSNRSLYVFRSRQLNDFAETLVLETRLPLPMPEMSSRSRVYVMELIDGYLVSVLVGTSLNWMEADYVTYDHTGLFLYETGAGKGSTLLHSRALASGYGSTIIYRGFVLAPGFRLLTDLARGVMYDRSKEATWPLLYHRFPPVVLLLAFCSMLVSGVGVYHVLKPVNLPRAAKITWVAIAAFSGMVGLASFYLGTYRKALAMQINLHRVPGQLPEREQFSHA